MFALCLLALTATPVFTAFECGLANNSPSGSARVVGGRADTFFKYPWFASIHPPFVLAHQTCAGALISPNFVLTAAHCFTSDSTLPKKDFYHVTLGIFDQCKDTPSAITYSISDVFVHQNYTDTENFYDIALMKLAGTSALMPLCLPPKGTPIKHVANAVVVGFGRRFSWNKIQPCQINEAVVKIFTNAECREQSAIPRNVTDAMVELQTSFCAGKMSGGTDSCQGDSGGSLLVRRGNRYFSMGIVSFGYGCAEKLLPGVYTNVASYIDWINKTMDGTLRMFQAPNAPRQRHKPLLRKLIDSALG